MSSTELRAAAIVGAPRDLDTAVGAVRPRRGSRRRARGAADVRAWGALDGLESQMLGQAGGPRRLEPGPGLTFMRLLGLGLAMVLAGVAAHWAWHQWRDGEETAAALPPLEAATPGEAQVASLAPMPASTEAAAPGPMQRDARGDDRPASLDGPSPLPAVVSAAAATRVSTTTTGLPARPLLRKGSAPVPTLFLDEVAQAPDDSNHEPVTQALFKTALPAHSAGAEPRPTAAGAFAAMAATAAAR